MIPLIAFPGLCPYTLREELLGSVNPIPGGQFPAGPLHGRLASWAKARPTSGPVSSRAVGSVSSEYGELRKPRKELWARQTLRA